MRRRRLALIAANVIAGTVLVGVLADSTGPTETTAAVAAVRERVDYVAKVLPSARPEFLSALAVNTYVVGHISAPQYGYLNAIAGDRVLADGPNAEIAEAALAAGAGICGQAAATAMTLYSALGIEARQLVISYPGNGHTTVEVKYDGDWHWFDPTWGTFYRAPDAQIDSVYSLADVLSLTDPAREAAYIGNDSMMWTQTVRAAGVSDAAGLDFLSFETLTVELVDGSKLYSRTPEITTRSGLRPSLELYGT